MSDLISKSALLNRIATEVHYDTENPLEQYARMMNLINNAPLEVAESVRHGHWIIGASRHFLDTRLGIGKEMKESTGKGYHTYQNRQCSVCRMISIVDDGIMYEYCPHCGAKMDGGEKE